MDRQNLEAKALSLSLLEFNAFTTVNEPRGELNFTFHLHIFTHSYRVKHVVCSPSKAVLDLI